MMRFGIPQLPAAARRARRRGRSGSSTSGVDARARTPRSTDILERDDAKAASTPPSSRSARTSASAPTSRPARRRRSSTPSPVLRSMEGEEQPLLGRRVVVYGGGNTAIDVARTAQAARRRPRRSSSTAARATGCPRTTSRSRRPLEEGVLMKWLSTIKQADDGKLAIEKMELDETGFPQPTGELEELEADSLVLALGQESDLVAARRRARARGRRRRRPGRRRT